MKTKRLTFCALLTAIALTIFVLEAQLPPPAPIPGMKLGLANVVTVFAMFELGPRDTLMILLSRIFLSSLFSGGATLLYALAGGMLCYLIMIPLHKVLTDQQMWICGCLGAAAHNIGQMGMAILITGTPQLAVYLTVLLGVGMVAGAFTGLAAQFVLHRIKNHMKD